MAIDTAQKRRSAAGNGSMPGGPGVTPQAAKSAAWRRDVAWTYSGNASGYGGTPAAGLPHCLPFIATMGSMKAF